MTMKLFTADYGEEKQPGVKVEHYDVADVRDIEVQKMKEQLDFLVETFTQRDAMQRTEIEMLKQYNDRLRDSNAQQAARLAYFQGIGQDEANKTMAAPQ